MVAIKTESRHVRELFHVFHRVSRVSRFARKNGARLDRGTVGNIVFRTRSKEFSVTRIAATLVTDELRVILGGYFRSTAYWKIVRTEHL